MTDISPRIMLFDLYWTGHHLQYLTQLAEYWIESRCIGILDIVVSTQFVDVHPEFSQFLEQDGARAGIRLHTADIDIDMLSDATRRLFAVDREHARLLKEFILKLKPDHCLFLVFDDVQISLASSLRFNYPVLFSGIYFRPFNRTGPGVIERLKRWRKSILLRAAVRNPHFDRLLCLDRTVVSEFSTDSARVVFLPDGIRIGHSIRSRDQIRLDWRVEEGRAVVLFFGGISRRKGIFEVLEAISLLSDSVRKDLCFVFHGTIDGTQRVAIENALTAAGKFSGVQLVVRNEFIDESDVQDIVGAADLNLVVYQKHTGSSGVLIRSAAARVPVLGSDYGLVGDNIRAHQLGRSVDSTSARIIADSLEEFIRRPEEFGFNQDAAEVFASENTADAFGRTIFESMTVAQPESSSGRSDT